MSKNKRKNKERYCDPEACPHCMYVGEGDFYCENYQTFVVGEWEPTDDFMICKGGANDE